MLVLSLLIVALLAATLQSMSGFGAGLIAVPLLGLLLPMTDIIPILSMQSLLLSAIISWRLRHYIFPGRYAALILGGMLFTPVGIISLLLVDLVLLQRVLGVFICLMALVLWFDFRKAVVENKVNLGLVGALSGWLNGLATLSGPPVVLFLTNQGHNKSEFRALLSFYFLLLAVVNLLVLGVAGVINSDNVTLGLLALPATLAGAIIGGKLVQYINEQQFRKFVIGLIAVVGVLLLWVN